MSRKTRDDLNQTFKIFVERYLYGEVAQKFDDHGAYVLDHYTGAGGWRIERILDNVNSVSAPFGDKRRSLAELIDCMHFAMDVIDHTKRRKVD